MSILESEINSLLSVVDSIQVEYYQHPIDTNATTIVYTLKGREVFKTIRCDDPNCDNGGYNLYDIIEEMISKRETIKKGKRICKGKIPRFNGSSIHTEFQKFCMNCITYKITSIYSSDR